jgi:hypothetical protein
MTEAFARLTAALRQAWVDIQAAIASARVIREAEQVVRDAYDRDEPSDL